MSKYCGMTLNKIELVIMTLYTNGAIQKTYNLDVNNSVNTSPICAQYVRNPGELWDVLVIVETDL